MICRFQSLEFVFENLRMLSSVEVFGEFVNFDLCCQTRKPVITYALTLRIAN